MKISLVIPVYNEADYLHACLNAIAAQTIEPYEVIVVDNNSTDKSAEVARSFNFVKVIEERHQGVVHARTTGFNAAAGDIIARIDADSLLPSNWLEQVKAIFSDLRVDAVCGQAGYYGVALADMVSRIDYLVRSQLSRRLQGRMYLWGANMALRKTAWLKVRSHLCETANQHEDFDLAIHLNEINAAVRFDERLKANVSSRRIDMPFRQFIHYTMMSPKTYTQHGLDVRRQMYPLVVFCWLVYLPGRVLYKGYDPTLNRFSLMRLMLGSKTLVRVDPTTYVA